jgi:LmbE family N-acetylglucosaminyl deacetylase
MTIQAAAVPGIPPARDADSLPSAVRVLAVTARPFQESADLGGLLYAFRRSGASLSLLCLTRGEGATPNSGNARRLEAARPWEVQMASLILGIGHLTVASYRDGSLHHYRTPDLARRIERAISEYSADLLLVVAPETGDVGDAAVARAAAAGAARAGIPAVARTRPGVSGSWTLDLGHDTEVARTIQKAAAGAHASQWESLPEVASQLDQLGSVETLRWLPSPVRVPAQYVRP